MAINNYDKKQEAQLSQRDCTMLGVIEHLARSLKVIRNDTLKKGASLYFIVIMSVCRTVFEIYSTK